MNLIDQTLCIFCHKYLHDCTCESSPSVSGEEIKGKIFEAVINIDNWGEKLVTAGIFNLFNQYSSYKEKRIEDLENGLAHMIKEYEYAMRLMAEATGVVYSENNVAISAKHLLTNK